MLVLPAHQTRSGPRRFHSESDRTDTFVRDKGSDGIAVFAAGRHGGGRVFLPRACTAAGPLGPSRASACVVAPEAMLAISVLARGADAARQRQQLVGALRHIGGSRAIERRQAPRPVDAHAGGGAIGTRVATAGDGDLVAVHRLISRWPSGRRSPARARRRLMRGWKSGRAAGRSRDPIRHATRRSGHRGRCDQGGAGLARVFLKLGAVTAAHSMRRSLPTGTGGRVPWCPFYIETTLRIKPCGRVSPSILRGQSRGRPSISGKRKRTGSSSRSRTRWRRRGGCTLIRLCTASYWPRGSTITPPGLSCCQQRPGWVLGGGVHENAIERSLLEAGRKLPRRSGQVMLFRAILGNRISASRVRVRGKAVDDVGTRRCQFASGSRPGSPSRAESPATVSTRLHPTCLGHQPHDRGWRCIVCPEAWAADMSSVKARAAEMALHEGAAVDHLHRLQHAVSVTPLERSWNRELASARGILGGQFDRGTSAPSRSWAGHRPAAADRECSPRDWRARGARVRSATSCRPPLNPQEACDRWGRPKSFHAVTGSLRRVALRRDAGCRGPRRRGEAGKVNVGRTPGNRSGPSVRRRAACARTTAPCLRRGLEGIVRASACRGRILRTAVAGRPCQRRPIAPATVPE